MLIHLHKQATTTPRVRAAIQESDVTQCYLSNVATWRQAWSEVIPLRDYAQTDLV